MFNDEFIRVMRAKGHSPILEEDGEVNWFFMDADYHNGPGCEACGWRDCHHCIEAKDIPECTADLIEGELIHRLNA